jgi:hypothetical protein
MLGAALFYVYYLAALSLPAAVGNVALKEPEVPSSAPSVTSMLQRAVEEKKLKEADVEEEASRMDDEVSHSRRVNCGQTCGNEASEHAASCAAPAATTETVIQLNDANQIIANPTKESDSNDPMAHVEAVCFLDAVSWPLFFVGLGLLLAGQFDWDQFLDGTELQYKLPEGSVRKLLTVIGLLAFAEGSTLFDARAFALSFSCGLIFFALPFLVTYRRRDV